MNYPLVSIITPTFNRSSFVNVLYDFVQAQTYPNIEWIIHDDSEEINEFLSQNSSSKIKYIHSAERLSVGKKRNELIKLASGDFIAQFDDDDFYSPEYIQTLMNKMMQENVDFIIFSAFFCFHLDLNLFGYYKTHLKKGPAYQFNRNGIKFLALESQNIPLIHFCYGWTYFFKKEVWVNQDFADINVFEDRTFLMKAIQDNYKVIFYEDQSGISAHSVHKKSSSVCFPQYLIPDFLVNNLFGAKKNEILRLREIALK